MDSAVGKGGRLGRRVGEAPFRDDDPSHGVRNDLNLKARLEVAFEAFGKGGLAGDLETVGDLIPDGFQRTDAGPFTRQKLEQIAARRGFDHRTQITGGLEPRHGLDDGLWPQRVLATQLDPPEVASLVARGSVVGMLSGEVGEKGCTARGWIEVGAQPFGGLAPFAGFFLGSLRRTPQVNEGDANAFRGGELGPFLFVRLANLLLGGDWNLVRVRTVLFEINGRDQALDAAAGFRVLIEAFGSGAMQERAVPNQVGEYRVPQFRVGKAGLARRPALDFSLELGTADGNTLDPGHGVGDLRTGGRSTPRCDDHRDQAEDLPERGMC